MNTFEVRDVSHWLVHSGEPIGSKAKDWMRPTPEGDLWLFKYCRDDAGDDWAEKVAEQLAVLVGLPHARVELATRSGRRGVISRDFRVLAGRPDAGAFVAANELLWESDGTYPKAKRRRIPQYTVERSMQVIERLRILPPWASIESRPATNAAEFFVGFLMFDAWIGNLDRHHENWGVVRIDADPNSASYLAPSFDHAASLGQNENDANRQFRLTTKDKRGRIETWARNRAKSCFYRDESGSRECTTLEAFDKARAICPTGASQWLARLEGVEWGPVDQVVRAVPESIQSPISRSFTLKLLDINRLDLLQRLTS